VHLDGHLVPMRITMAKMRLDGTDAVFVSGQDISETRELERSLRKASAEAGAASRLKSQFLANMSHEVRTPLAAIMGVAELGRGANTLSEARELFSTVAGAGQTLLSLANDLLDVSRLEAGRLRIEEGSVEVKALVAQSVGLLQAQARAKGLALEVFIEPDERSVVKGDRGRLGQVLTNLLSNAVKFTEKGSTVVRAKASGGQLTLSVTDTGVGLSPAQQERLFEPFTQVDESATRRYGGAGLGLALSRQIARLMGGELMLESAVGKGSTFTCTVPAPLLGDQVVLPSAPQLIADLANLRVLVVEDNKVNQLLATTLLKKAGASSEVAENGVLAIERLERGPTDFDVVLMDVQMPELDGLETTRALRRRAQFEKTPIVALTAHALEEERERCLAAGMNGYLSKPIEVQAFYSVLSQFVPTAAK
jgi:signal transduction histidine kinase/ActR/RegA family two-component response regulator